jgi:propionyl-CoA synthetase
LLPIVPGSPAKPVKGYKIAVLCDNGYPVADGDIGALVIECPLPPGSFTTLWNTDGRFVSSCFASFPGY